MAATGFTPLSLYYSATTTHVPTSGNLVNGELAINTADGKLFYKDSSGVVQTIATKNTASGVFTSVTDSALTSGRVTYASTGGLLADSASLTYDGTTLTSTKFAGAFNGSLGATTPSTVVATTGTFKGTAGVNTTGVSLSDTTTGSNNILLTNTSGALQLGIESSAGGVLITGSAPYSTVIAAASGKNILFCNNGGLSAAATIDSSGNLGLGVTPNTWSLGKAMEVNSGGNALWSAGPADIRLTAGAYYNGAYKYGNTGGNVAAYEIAGGTHVWRYAGGGTINGTITFTQAMTLDASGNLIVGGSTSYGQITSVNSTAVANLIGLLDSGTTYGSSSYYMILRNSVGTVSGGIQHTASTTVNYATTSDERLKEDKGIATDTSVIDNIIIHDFKWIEDNHLDRGVFAQEAYEIKPSAVGVGNDEITESGALENPWSVDYSKFVPDLIVHAQQLKKLVEQQQAMIDELKAKVAALEAA